MENWKSKAERMVKEQLIPRGISDKEVISALKNVPRHMFVPKQLQKWAYDDCPLPLGGGQTISQPYIVALMTSLLQVNQGMKILEIGTGSGYQAAVLAYIGTDVYSVERVRSLALSSSSLLQALGYKVSVHHGDGRLGLPREAPFDRILLTAATDDLPRPLLDQAASGCRIVAPIRSKSGIERLLIRTFDGTIQYDEWSDYCRFVPLLENTTD